MGITIDLNMGQIIPIKPNPFANEIIRTQNGTFVVIPAMVGTSTVVKPLKDGTYEVTKRASVLNSKPQTKILTEEQLIAQYGPKTGKNLQTIA